MTPTEQVPLRADAERNRLRLLQAAREVFAERGIDVTLDDIARHAGVGTGTAYRRFPNKDAVIEALMVGRIDEMTDIARSCLEHDDPWDGLTSYFERALALQTADRGLKEVLFSAAAGRENVALARDRLFPVVEELVQRAIAAGAVRSDFAASDVPLINFMLNTVVDFSHTEEPELYRRYLAIILEGLRPPANEPQQLPVQALTISQFQSALTNRRRK